MNCIDGLYFCEKQYIVFYIWLYNREMNIRKVTIPNDARINVIKEGVNKMFKTDKIILGEEISLTDFFSNQPYEFNLAAVKRDGMILQYINTPNQTEDICLAAVTQNTDAIQYVITKTPEIYKVVVKPGNQLTGVNFNAININGVEFYKILNEKEYHHGFQYKDGLNIDTNEFNTEKCSAGGLYFCEKQYIGLYIGYGIYIRKVSIPNDARISIEDNKFKADKIILGERLSLTDFFSNQTYEFNLAAVKQNGMALQYINTPNQTDEICVSAITQNCDAIQHVITKTFELYKVAVKHGYKIETGIEFNSINMNGVEFYKILNEKENHHGFQYNDGLNIDTNEFNTHTCSAGGLYFCEKKYISLYIHYGIYIRKVSIPNDARISIERYKFKADKIILGERQSLKDFFSNQTYEFILAAVTQNGNALYHVNKECQTPELCLAAVTQNGNAMEYVNAKHKMEMHWNKLMNMNKQNRMSSV
jgi:hypothetical protein